MRRENSRDILYGLMTSVQMDVQSLGARSGVNIFVQIYKKLAS
jgi:hypothetical protein